ncbi:MAG: hypothetical protein ACOWYE_00075 [Desulfatiglandales bacterium]
MTGKSESRGERIRKWLEGAEAQRFLRNTAQRILLEARSRDLPPAFLGASTWEKEESTRLVDDICQELAALIQEQPVQRAVLALESRAAGAYLKKVFFNRWVDFSRKKNSDAPWHYIYSRARRVLHEAQGDFHMHQEKGTHAAWFSGAGDSTPCGPLADEDLKDIPFPAHLADRLIVEKIQGKKTLLELAAHFLGEISSRFYGKAPVRVRLNDFVTWLGLHVVLRRTRVETRAGEDLDPLDTLVSPDNAPGSGFDPQRIRAWAGMLTKQLNPSERHAFYLKWGENLPLRTIASRMGYRGESGPEYRIDRALEKMQDFTRDLEGLSPEEPDEEARSFFFQVLMEFLKKSVTDP